MWWRIVYGSFKTILGLALLKVIDVPLLDLLQKTMHHELAQGPHDYVFHTISILLTNHPLSVTYFLAWYLIFWGLLEVIMSLLLLRHKIWAFPVSIGLIILFIIFEAVRYTHTHSPVLLGAIILDTVILWLIKGEYDKIKRLIALSHTPLDT